MPIFKVCKEDPIVKMIRQNYQAIPIRNPSQLFQPLYAFAWLSGEPVKLGQLKHLLNDGNSLNIAPQPFDTKTLEGQKTRRINTDLGLDMLGAFLKPLGLNAINLSSKLASARQVSFSLGAVGGLAIDRGELGGKLGNFTLNTNNLVFNDEIKSGEGRLLLIDSILASTDFSFTVEKSSEVDFSFDTPDVLNDFIDPDAKVDVDTSKKNELRFKTEDALSFAFTCIELKVDWSTGRFTGFEMETGDISALGDSEESSGDNTEKISRAKLGLDDGEMIEF